MTKRKSKSTTKGKSTPSRGVRSRLGRPVQDADDPISMYLTAADIARAKAKRGGYDVDEPENFTECALAECLGKMTGAEVLVMRRYAFVALPDEPYTLRYQLDAVTADVVKANDERRLGDVHANTPVNFKPPTPGRRLIAQGGERESKQSRGILANPPRPSEGDPYQGVYRNGVHANG
jgi:hypothetical protein